MDHNITPELVAAFAKRAAVLGYDITPAQDEKLAFTVSKHGAEVCEFEKGGAMRYYPDNPLVTDRQQLHHLMCDMKEVHNLYLDAKPLPITDLEDWRLLSEFGGYLLAAKLYKDNEIHCTTWQYTYDRTGVTLGHYYETNYKGAVADFAQRAGLVDQIQIFTEEELVILHDSCVFRGRNDEDITFEDERGLEAVMEKVESNIPNYIFDREQEHDHGQDMEV